MGGSKSKNKSVKNATNSNVNTSVSPRIMQRRLRVPGNYFVIWLSEQTGLTNEDNTRTLTELQKIVSNLYTCVKYDKCFDFIIEHEHEKVILILSTTIEKVRVRQIHDMPQIHSIYIYGNTTSSYASWETEFNKIQGIYKEIESICEALRETIWQSSQSDTLISCFGSYDEGVEPTLDELDPTFMYTELLKQIILNTQNSKQAERDFIDFLRAENKMHDIRLKSIDKFERDHSPKNFIRWYSCEPLFYELVNSSLRNFEAGKIIKIGFFISNLHRQLEDLQKQRISRDQGKLKLYRGQGVSPDAFEKFEEGNLLSFNYFLSTSENEEVALTYAEGTLGKPNTVVVVFNMCIDPNTPSTPFASVKDISQFRDEEEVLFSMQAVFRIRGILKHPKNSAIYQVDLELTFNEDQQLRKLKECIRHEIDDESDWQRLGKLLIKIGQCNEAEQFYTTILEKQSRDSNTEEHIYYHLGIVKSEQREYRDAVSFFQKVLEIRRHSPSKDLASFPTIYSNIGHAYKGMGDYLKALEFYGAAYKILESDPHCNRSLFVSVCSGIGTVYHDMGEYSEALEFYQIARDAYKIILPPNHPLLASAYNNIGELYTYLGNYSKALESHKLSFEIK